MATQNRRYVNHDRGDALPILDRGQFVNSERGIPQSDSVGTFADNQDQPRSFHNEEFTKVSDVKMVNWESSEITLDEAVAIQRSYIAQRDNDDLPNAARKVFADMANRLYAAILVADSDLAASIDPKMAEQAAIVDRVNVIRVSLLDSLNAEITAMEAADLDAESIAGMFGKLRFDGLAFTLAKIERVKRTDDQKAEAKRLKLEADNARADEVVDAMRHFDRKLEIKADRGLKLPKPSPTWIKRGWYADDGTRIKGLEFVHAAICGTATQTEADTDGDTDGDS